METEEETRARLENCAATSRLRLVMEREEERRGKKVMNLISELRLVLSKTNFFKE